MQNPQNPYNQPPITPPTGGYSPYPNQFPPGANNSGMGAQSVLPDELKGMNGGAFFLTLFWSIAHSTWIGLLCLIPYIGWIMAFVMLFKGNEFAWQNRKWDSIEQFREVQKKWLIWGIVIFVVSAVLSFLLLALGGAMMVANNQVSAPPPVTPQ